MNILQEKASAGAVALEELETKIKGFETSKADKAKELKACEAEKSKLQKEAEKMKSELDLLAEQ